MCRSHKDPFGDSRMYACAIEILIIVKNDQGFTRKPDAGALGFLRCVDPTGYMLRKDIAAELRRGKMVMERAHCCINAVLLAHTSRNRFGSHLGLCTTADLDCVVKLVDGKLSVGYGQRAGTGRGDNTTPEWLTSMIRCWVWVLIIGEEHSLSEERHDSCGLAIHETTGRSSSTTMMYDSTNSLEEPLCRALDMSLVCKCH